MSDEAVFIGWIDGPQDDPDLIDSILYETFLRRREHAVLSLEGGRRVLVRGGFDGITFGKDKAGKPTVSIDAGPATVASLLWHTHPVPTGPSDQDRAMLRRLGQATSVVYEVGTDRAGTTFGMQKPPAQK